VVGGYCTSLLAEMKPFTLDLETMYWRCWPGIKEEDLGTVQLPQPRQRMAAMRVTSDWLLVSGGSPTSASVPAQRIHSCICLVEGYDMAALSTLASRGSRRMRVFACRGVSWKTCSAFTCPPSRGAVPQKYPGGLRARCAALQATPLLACWLLGAVSLPSWESCPLRSWTCCF
jgi:hypothetical protein